MMAPSMSDDLGNLVTMWGMTWTSDAHIDVESVITPNGNNETELLL